MAKKNIYEACNSQYITGQRIDEVASTLNCMEEKARGLRDFFVGVRLSASKTSKKNLVKKNKRQVIDEYSLNESQVINKSKSQPGIDSLLASFTRT